MMRIVAIERSPVTTSDVTDRVVIDHDRRSRRRMVLQTEGGATLLLDRDRPLTLRGGDVLVCDDGTRVRVEALPEDLLEIRADSTAGLVRIAWHLGNRHIPTQLMLDDDDDRIRIRRDHVIAEMVAGLGGSYCLVSAAFDPEGGAYATGEVHAHRQAHSHSHSHSHSHGHGHSGGGHRDHDD